MQLPVMPPVKPMLAKAVPAIPTGALSYEPKWDGFRSIVFRDGDEVEIGSRNERPMTRYFPEVVEAVKANLPERCVVDGELIVRVLQNLLGNALKFSGYNSTVTVRAGLAPAGLRRAPLDESGQPAPALLVAVNDQGIGIAPNDQEKIFAKFSQVGERRGGTGLGLTFCKLVVEAHDGQIWVESAPGAGSTFFFTLPLARLTLPAAQPLATAPAD